MARTHHGDVRPKGVTILSSIWFVMAALNVLIGLGAALGGTAILNVFTEAAGAVTGGFLGAFGVAILLIGIVQLFIGWGLWTLREWARTAAIVFAIIGLLNFPIGTILSVIVLVYLFQPEVKDAFEPGPSKVGRGTPSRRRV